jgi:long-chain acyl-CoA synthetase
MKAMATVPTTAEDRFLRGSTGSRTIADLLARAAEQYADRPAVCVKRDGAWERVTFAEVGEIVSELARGLIDLGIGPGERVCILATTRPEWTYADFAIASIGAVKVTIYPTSSLEQCEWVAGNSEAAAVICEDRSQLDKLRAVRTRLPQLRHLIVIESGDADTADVISVQQLRRRGTARRRAELTERSAAVQRQDPYTFMYTSGTTGPPKGCVLSHGNYRDVVDMCHQQEVLTETDTTYLHLPLAHAYGLLHELLSFDTGGTLAYFGGDVTQIVAELQEIQPSFLPSVPRIFEKIYSVATGPIEQAAPERREQFRRAVEVGVAVREMQLRGESIPEDLQSGFDAGEQLLYARVRGLFGGKLRGGNSGAAPIAPEILEFFFACGVPVLEGYGMTETATVVSYCTLEHHRFGTVGRPLPGCEVRIAPDGEVLIRGANIFGGYYKNDDATAAAFGDSVDPGGDSDGAAHAERDSPHDATRSVWLHTGDLGSLDEDGYLRITGRKKDIIITAGGKNITPANLENDMKQVRWVSQAVMYGDRRPYPVMLITLAEEEIGDWARDRGLPEDVATLSAHPDVRALIAAELERANARYASVEQVKKFVLLDHDLTQEDGELTPTLKLKRNVVNEHYARELDALYTDGA